LPDDYGILKDERFAEVDTESIVPNPDQPRLRFESKAIEELSQSIRETGVIQPLLVAPDGENYRLIVGERRWRAAMKAGLKKVPVLIRMIPRERQLEISLIENLHREDLNPLEVAFVYQRMIKELSCTQEDIAVRVGKDRTSITNYLRLLTLPKVVQDYLAEDKISMGHARALASLESSEAQETLAHEIVRRELSVRDVERMISARKKEPRGEKKAVLDPDLRALEEDLVRHLGTKVVVSGTRKKGTIRISYFSLEDLNRLYGKIKGAS
jgi:ParB family chromosome partitioning protein